MLKSNPRGCQPSNNSGGEYNQFRGRGEVTIIPEEGGKKTNNNEDMVNDNEEEKRMREE